MVSPTTRMNMGGSYYYTFACYCRYFEIEKMIRVVSCIVTLPKMQYICRCHMSANPGLLIMNSQPTYQWENSFLGSLVVKYKLLGSLVFKIRHLLMLEVSSFYSNFCHLISVESFIEL
jgi:hypothetical protein